MPAYRFCRPDDLQLLIKAVNSCIYSHFPDKSPLTEEGYAELVREQGLWASSCMLTFERNQTDVISAIIGCRRGNETLIHAIGTRPEYQRRGHIKHMLTSLSGKLSILGPPDMWVEISSDRLDLISLFRELGYEARESYLTMLFEPNPEQVERNVPVERFTVADATSLSLLEFTERRSWLRQKDNIEAQALLGRALISSERVESCVFYCEKGGYVSVSCAEAPGGDLALEALLTALAKEYGKPLLFPRVNKSESAYQTLVRMGASIVEWYLGYYCRASRDS